MAIYGAGLGGQSVTQCDVTLQTDTIMPKKERRQVRYGESPSSNAGIVAVHDTVSPFAERLGRANQEKSVRGAIGILARCHYCYEEKEYFECN